MIDVIITSPEIIRLVNWMQECHFFPVSGECVYVGWHTRHNHYITGNDSDWRLECVCSVSYTWVTCGWRSWVVQTWGSLRQWVRGQRLRFSGSLSPRVWLASTPLAPAHPSQLEKKHTVQNKCKENFSGQSEKSVPLFKVNIFPERIKFCWKQELTITGNNVFIDGL